MKVYTDLLIEIMQEVESTVKNINKILNSLVLIMCFITLIIFCMCYSSIVFHKVHTWEVLEQLSIMLWSSIILVALLVIKDLIKFIHKWFITLANITVGKELYKDISVSYLLLIIIELVNLSKLLITLSNTYSVMSTISFNFVLKIFGSYLATMVIIIIFNIILRPIVILSDKKEMKEKIKDQRFKVK